jgi:hypothetical protein
MRNLRELNFILLFFLLIGLALVSFAQDNQITNDKFKFTLTHPIGLSPVVDGYTVLEFRGTSEKYGTDAVFFLKNVSRVKAEPIEAVEEYMKESANIESINTNFIKEMKQTFPDIVSIDNSFIYFNQRPALQGFYTFTVRKTPMKGRYLFVLVKEQSSIYSFSWTSKASGYEIWNKASEDTVKSLKIK